MASLLSANSDVRKEWTYLKKKICTKDGNTASHLYAILDVQEL